MVVDFDEKQRCHPPSGNGFLGCGVLFRYFKPLANQHEKKTVIKIDSQRLMRLYALPPPPETGKYHSSLYFIIITKTPDTMLSITSAKKQIFMSITVFIFMLTSSVITEASNTNSASGQSLALHNLTKKPSKPKRVKIRARITYYSIGQDKWGSLNACPKTKRSKIGVTVAAHPKFKFGTKLTIPKLKGIVGDGNFIVQDRGGAVTRKTASKGKHYVFDVYVTPAQRRKYATQLPEYMDVYVIK